MMMQYLWYAARRPTDGLQLSTPSALSTDSNCPPSSSSVYWNLSVIYQQHLWHYPERKMTCTAVIEDIDALCIWLTPSVTSAIKRCKKTSPVHAYQIALSLPRVMVQAWDQRAHNKKHEGMQIHQSRYSRYRRPNAQPVLCGAFI